MTSISIRHYPFHKILIKVIVIFLAHHLSMLLHEWTHGTFAWIFGYKTNPFAIYYGDWTLLDAWELVDYKAILAKGKGWIVAIIGISPIIVGATLYLIGIKVLSIPKIKNIKLLWYFLFWFTLSNLGQVLDYVPVRTFTNYSNGLLDGDIGHFLQGLHLSPWVIFFPGTIFVIIAIWEFFKVEVPQLYAVMEISSFHRKWYLLVVLLYLFAWYGASGFHSSAISKDFSRLSILMIPILFTICNPARNWVK